MTISLKPSTFAPDTPAPAPAPTKGIDKVASGLLQSVSMREATLPLSALQDGDFFRLELQEFDRPGSTKLVHLGWVYGQRVYGNNCRVRVRLAAGQTQVVFDEAGGKQRQFESSGISEVSYPTMLEVVRIDPTAEEAQPSVLTRSERESTMESAQAKALQKRYEFCTAQLAKAEGDAAKTEVAQKRLEAVIVEAEEKGVSLTEPTAVAPTPNGGASKVAPTAIAQTKVMEQKKADAKGVAALKAKADKAKTPKEPKLPTTQNCLCGCGLETGGKFRPGHDARVKGMLYKVERGEAQFDDLPEALRAVTKFAGKKATVGKENQDYRIVQAPVKFPGRPDIAVV